MEFLMNIRTADTSAAELSCDLLTIGIAKDQVSSAVAAFESAFGGTLADTLKRDEFTGKSGQTASYPSFGGLGAPKVLFVGLGDGGLKSIIAAAGQAGSHARKMGANTVGLGLGTLDTNGTLRAVEAFAVGNYRFDKYKAESDRKASTADLLIIGDHDTSATTRASAIAGGQALARDLVNEPAAAIYPETLADVALSLANESMTVEVWDHNKIKAEGMGGITAVGQGSHRKARFIHMHYKPAGTPRKKIALVGKGVTFDSGGYSLKPSGGMQTMRCDMAGSAAVIGTMRTIRDLAPDVEVHGIVGAAENLINGEAYKLGDILTMHNGKTVEIHNTDAEGRLVLADCLSYASKLGVDSIVDLATLTGACVVALGDHYVGLFTKSDELAGGLAAGAETAGEQIWRMPLPDAYKEMLKADWGTIKNVGGRAGGAITAALFLSEFVDAPAWAHLDIAGPAFLDKGYKHIASGGTGTMVPTLSEWITA
jgi:leucyl aminopeptidase